MKAQKDDPISLTSFLLLIIRNAALTLPITSFPDLRNYRPGAASLPRDEFAFDSSLQLQKEHERTGGVLRSLSTKELYKQSEFYPLIEESH